MYGYYLRLGVGGLKANPVITALMVLAMAMGIAACTTTLTVLHVLSGDPLPGRSALLFHPQLEPRPANGAHTEPPDDMAWIDAMALLASAPARQQAAMASAELPVHPLDSGARAFNVGVRTTTRGFFDLFRPPMLVGSGWSSDDDARHARVTVLSSALATRLFGTNSPIGKTLRLRDVDFSVVGVMADWRPVPRFYDLGGGGYSRADDVYIPLSTSRDMAVQATGAVTCWGSDFDPVHLDRAPCAWLQVWVELDGAAEVAAYRDFLSRYSIDQQTAGRFQQPPNIRLRSLDEWLAFKQVVPDDATLLVWLAFGFLLICVANTSGLLLSKFLRRSGEMTVRRALGARRRDIFFQVLVEAALVGVLGGLFGILLSIFGVLVVRRQPVEYAELALLDLPMVVAGLVVTLAASTLAAILPAVLASRSSMSIQLKAAG